MDTSSIQLSDFPIVVRPRKDANQGPHIIRQRAICDAVDAALGLPAPIKVDAHVAYATLHYCVSGAKGPETEYRVRVNGFANGQGSKKTREYLAISLVGLQGNKVIGWSEDLATTPRNVALLTFVGADGKETPITDRIRALVAKKATSPAPKAKKTAEKTAEKAEEKKAPATLVLVPESPIRSVDFSPDGRWIATTHEDQHLVLWDATTGQQRWSKRAGGSGMQFAQAAAFSPDSRLVASGSSTLKIFEVGTGKPVKAPPGHPKGELVDLAWGAAGLVTASWTGVQKADKSVALWDVARGTLLKKWDWERARHVELLPGQPAIAVLAEQTLSRINLATGAIVTHHTPIDDGRECCSFAPTKQDVWVATDEEIQLLDTKTFAVLRAFARAGTAILAADATGSVLISVVGETTGERLQRLDPTNGTVLVEWKLPTGVPGMKAHMAALVARAKGKHVVDRYDDNTPMLVDLAVSPAGDRVVAATAMAMGIWTPDGVPVISPSAGGKGA